MPRSSLRFLIWSPKVFSIFGYLGDFGFLAFRVAWQKGNAGMSLRLPHRPAKGMRLHAATNPTLSFPRLRPAPRPHRHPSRSAGDPLSRSRQPRRRRTVGDHSPASQQCARRPTATFPEKKHPRQRADGRQRYQALLRRERRRGEAA